MKSPRELLNAGVEGSLFGVDAAYRTDVCNVEAL